MRSWRDRHARWVTIARIALALGSGIGSVLLLRRGLSFAPAAVAATVIAWTLTAVIARFLPEDSERNPKRRITRIVATTLIASLYQDVLFFLLPIWIEAATWPSWNSIAPILIGGMALFSCVESIHLKLMIERPSWRAAFSAVVLFASLLTATPVLTSLSLRPSLAISMIISLALGGAAAIPSERLRSGKTLVVLVGAGAICTGFLMSAAPVFPPVPVSCLSARTALRVEDKEPLDVMRVFPSGTPRVYAHFAVASPLRFSEHVYFRWIHDGQTLPRQVETSILGGRNAGFRTFAFTSNPKSGAWQVELVTDAGQLIARTEFSVEPNP